MSPKSHFLALIPTHKHSALKAHFPWCAWPKQEGGDKIEYRVWNPFRSKLAAAVLAGVDNIHIKPGERTGRVMLVAMRAQRASFFYGS